MFDALPLLPRSDLHEYKKLAGDFQRACAAGSHAVREWSAALAAENARAKPAASASDRVKEIRASIQGVEREWQRIQQHTHYGAGCTLAQAELLIARCHGFASWDKFAEHVEAAAQPDSPVSQFESAADAIGLGDISTLTKLLRNNPELVQMRSSREHGSTLLHYVSANGVEDFRQTTPANIVQIAEALLDAGADVNAESNAYEGHSTPLGLTATSCHPERAGVQIALLELLLARGAILDGTHGGSTVNACLHNGRGKAAEFLASRGAHLDLEGAAGVGRLDLVRRFFEQDGGVKDPATQQQVLDGFAWACEFGRKDVVEFLLEHGVAANSVLSHGATGLHWAAYDGNAEIVTLLLDHGAPVRIRDARFHGTPLDWAMHEWTESLADPAHRNYYQVAARLVRAGAEPEPAWFHETNDGPNVRFAKLRADPVMQAALRGEIPP